MQPLREFNDRLREDIPFRRTVTLLLVFFLALVAELVVLGLDLVGHQDLLVHSAVTIAAILLPFTMLAAAARTPAGKAKVKRRFIIRPFGTITEKPKYSGEAIAALIYRDIVAWQSSASGRVAWRTQPSSLSPAHVSLGSASFPLDWLWTQTRYLITGKSDVVIDGLLIDSDESFSLKVWTNDTPYTWTCILDSGPFAEALEREIAKLTPDILESLDPFLSARILESQWNYDDAIRLMTGQEGQQYQLACAETMLSAEHLTQAQGKLEQIKKRRKATDVIQVELRRLEADLLIRRGDLKKGRELLRSAIVHPKCRPQQMYVLLRAEAAALAYEDDYLNAALKFAEARESAERELCRLAREKRLKSVSDVLDWSLFGNAREEAKNVLSALPEIGQDRATCRKRLGEDPNGLLEDLERARAASVVVRHLESSPSADSPLLEAVVHKALAHHYLDSGNIDLCQQSAVDALNSYEEAIQMLTLSIGPTTDDMGLVVDLAWAQCGRLSCLLKLQATGDHSEPPPPQAGALYFTRLVRALSPERRTSFKALFQRLRNLARRQSAKYGEHLQQTASALADALFSELQDPRFLSGIVEQLETLGSVTPDERSGTPKISAAVQEHIAKFQLDAGDVERFYHATYALLDMLVQYENQEQVNVWLDAAHVTVVIEESRNEAQTLFNDMLERPTKRLKAEGCYGLACLSAIDGDPAMAVRYLRLAGEQAREGTVTYLNRAKLDEDFDAIRSNPDFGQLLASIVASPKSGRRQIVTGA